MRVSLLGCGVVGLGVYNIIRDNPDLGIVNVLVRPEEKDTVPETVLSIDEVVTGDADVVVECMGGVDFAFMCAEKCIRAGKGFVTSNKALVAAKGLELSRLAQENGVSFLFSAACGGAIPILHNIAVARETDRIQRVGGILNGTTNFILSSLREGLFSNYSDALSEAKRLGYAEADPTADVSGMDTMRKVVLLSAVAFGVLPVDGWNCEGIESIDLCPPQFRKGAYSVKLMGRAEKSETGSISAYVHPVIFKTESLFGSVNSNYNMPYYVGTNSGFISLYGQGAGRMPTASAILRDLTAILGVRESGVSRARSVMLPDDLLAGRADNSGDKRKFLYSSDGRSFEEVCVPVSEIHARARSIRESGGKVFFAEVEESVLGR